MATTFSAGAQALGYLHQVRYSLYSLLADQRGDTQLYVEELDDVVRKNKDIQTLEQLKHHMDADATINEYSTELWRTLRVWFTEWDEGKLKPEEAVLCLITTATAEADSPAAYLRPGDTRDVKKARERLVEVATAAKSTSLGKAFAAFLNTKVSGTDQVRSELDQDRLLASVLVIDGSLTIDQVEPKIKQLINGIRASNVNAAYERLEGWWFNKIVQHLLGGSKNPVSQYAVKEMIAEIGEQFRPDSLPIDYEDYELTPLQETEHGSRLFVQQLSAINIVGMRLYNAVLDYYRAFEQRSKWTRDALIIDDDLLKYERSLVREWRRYMGILESKLPQEATETDQLNLGVELLDWMELKANFPIRRDMPIGHEYVMRGSFHLLADAEAPRVYWHPQFLKQLEAILKPA